MTARLGLCGISQRLHADDACVCRRALRASRGRPCLHHGLSARSCAELCAKKSRHGFAFCQKLAPFRRPFRLTVHAALCDTLPHPTRTISRWRTQTTVSHTANSLRLDWVTNARRDATLSSYCPSSSMVPPFPPTTWGDRRSKFFSVKFCFPPHVLLALAPTNHHGRC